MHYAKRVSELRPSLTIALGTQAQKLQAQGERICNLASGEPWYPTPPVIKQEATNILARDRIGYTNAGGTPEMRQAIVTKYQRENQLDYTADEVVVGCGSKEILLHSCMSILDRDDEVILLSPYWVSYTEQIKLCEAKAVIVPFAMQQPLPSSEQLERYATPRTKAIVLNFPNNPSGYMPSKSAYAELGEYLQTKNWWIISDEIYEYLVFNRERCHYSLLNICPQLRERTILVNGLSKGFAMTGWRVGYALATKTLVANVKKLQSHSTTCLPLFIEKAAIVALTHGKPLMQEMLDNIGANQQRAQQLLNSMPEVACPPAQGAFYVFPCLPAWLASTQCPNTLAFSEWLLREYKVAVTPGEVFGAAGHLRINCATPANYLQRGLELLGQALTKLKDTQ